MSSYWSRAIILMDLNAFFASVEQLDFPELRGRPVAVTNGSLGSCIITCSYEARRYGIKTGMRLYEARTLCPELIQCASRPERYTRISSVIMQALTELTPCIEIFSIDEAFLDVTETQTLFGDPEKIAHRVKEIVYECSGLLCSVGVSADKTSAKFAAKQNKPDGLTVIEPELVEQRLAHVPVTELCGIGPGIGTFLKQRGVVLCKEMASIPVEVLSRKYGPLGHRIWHMAQGKDYAELCTETVAPKTIGHGKVLPPGTRARCIIETYLYWMSEKVAYRMRQYQFKAQTYAISLQTKRRKIRQIFKLEVSNHDGHAIYQLSQILLNCSWQGEVVSHVQITALDPNRVQVQPDFFHTENQHKNNINELMDVVNEKFGPDALMSAKLLKRAPMPNVIAPAWRPTGVRRSV